MSDDRCLALYAGKGARRLVTELEVLRISRAKESLPDHALLAPSVSDRALALGLLRP